MGKASVSVVIPCYNSVDTIERAIKSISKQTLLPNEVIIVDDCSTDKRMEDVIKNLELKYKAFFFLNVLKNSKNQGPGVSRNNGWKVSNENYIAFLDADDAWNKRKIELQYNYMLKNPNVDFSCHETVRVLNGITHYKRGKFRLKKITFRKLLLKNKIGTRTVMMKRSIKNRFISNKYYSEDFLLWLEIAYSNYDMVKLYIPLSWAYSHPFLGEGLSGNFEKMYKGELDTYKSLHEYKKIGILTYNICICFITCKFIRRIVISKISHKSN